ncbi:hypothetical protein R1sor_012679 [Riccia sorocarpa]|uniref:Uncharacterized protein n=1 Tax=Riccia sorocarpa TaxID=122646 RepID=A0ABD3I4T0_9MARC
MQSLCSEVLFQVFPFLCLYCVQHCFHHCLLLRVVVWFSENVRESGDFAAAVRASSLLARTILHASEVQGRASGILWVFSSGVASLLAYEVVGGCVWGGVGMELMFGAGDFGLCIVTVTPVALIKILKSVEVPYGAAAVWSLVGLLGPAAIVAAFAICRDEEGGAIPCFSLSGSLSEQQERPSRYPVFCSSWKSEFYWLLVL